MDYVFHYKSRIKTPRAIAGHYAGVRPFVGFVKGDTQYFGGLNKLVAKRRDWLDSLVEHGLDAWTERRLDYVRNCKPDGVVLAGPARRGCGLSFCPLCYARTVTTIYDKLAGVRAKLPELVLSGYRVEHEQLVDVCELPLDVNEEVTFMRQVLPLAVAYKKNFTATILPDDVLLGWSRMFFMPKMDDKALVGINVTYCTVALCRSAGSHKDVRICETYEAYEAAEFIGNIMRYPSKLFAADSRISAKLINEFSKKRLLTRIGEYGIDNASTVAELQ